MTERIIINPKRFHTGNTRMPLEMYLEAVELGTKLNLSFSALNRKALSELFKRSRAKGISTKAAVL